MPFFNQQFNKMIEGDVYSAKQVFTVGQPGPTSITW
jgi:hypothetical protein